MPVSGFKWHLVGLCFYEHIMAVIYHTANSDEQRDGKHEKMNAVQNI